MYNLGNLGFLGLTNVAAPVCMMLLSFFIVQRKIGVRTTLHTREGKEEEGAQASIHPSTIIGTLTWT